MNRILLSLSALAAAAAAAPAAAQNGYYNPGSYDDRGYDDRGHIDTRLAERIERLQQRIRNGVERGRINRNEAYALRREHRELADLEHWYGQNGIDYAERRDLQRRIQNLRQRIQYAGGMSRGYPGANPWQYSNNSGFDPSGRDYEDRDRYDRGDDDEWSEDDD